MNFTLLCFVQLQPKLDKYEALKLAVLRQLPQIESAFDVKANRHKLQIESEEKGRIMVYKAPLTISFDLEFRMPRYVANDSESSKRMKVRPLQGDFYRTDSEWRIHAVRAVSKLWLDVKFISQNCRLQRFGEEKLRGLSSWTSNSNVVSMSMPVTYRGKSGTSAILFDRATGGLLVAHCGGLNSKRRVVLADAMERKG